MKMSGGEEGEPRVVCAMEKECVAEAYVKVWSRTVGFSLEDVILTMFCDDLKSSSDIYADNPGEIEGGVVGWYRKTRQIFNLSEAYSLTWWMRRRR